ncbi:hypothetical protein D3C80_2078390 [compost metagenome]
MRKKDDFAFTRQLDELRINRWLILVNIKACTGDFAIAQALDHCGLIYDVAACRVDDVTCRLH